MSRLLRPSIGGCLCLVLAIGTGVHVAAQQDRGVRLDGNLVLRVGPLADTTAEERARETEARLNAVLDRSGAAVEAAVRRSNANRAFRDIVVAGNVVVTVTPDDAAANGTDVEHLAAEWAAQVQTELLESRNRRSSALQRFRFQVRSSVSSALARLLETLAATFPRLLAALVIVAICWGFASLLRRAMRTSVLRLVHDRTLHHFASQSAYYLVWITGFLVALDAMGFNPQTFVTGLGLTSVALGFALKDVLSNMVSGVLLQAFRPFELGDQIVVGSVEGSVERIDLRATHIRKYDGCLVLVPNGEVFTSRVTNNTAAPLRRGTIDINLGFDVDLDRALRVAAEAAQQAHGVASQPPAYSRVRELNVGTAHLQVLFWTDSKRIDFMATSSVVQMAILRGLRDAGISLPDPSPRLVLPPGVAPPLQATTSDAEQAEVMGAVHSNKRPS